MPEPRQELRRLLRRHLDDRVAGHGIANLCIRWAGETVSLPLGLESEPAGGEPRFLAYSITKSFLAALILKLCRRTELALDGTLGRWLPEVPDASRITLRQLLRNTAGIPDYGGLPEFHDAVRRSPQTPWSFEEFARHTWEPGLDRAPGKAFAYSNPGYMILKRVAELAGEAAFAELIRSEILAPLDLHHTSVPLVVADLAGLILVVSRWVTAGDEPVDVRAVYHPGWVSHGTLDSTPGNVVRFFDALFSGRLLDEDELRQMTEPVRVPDAPPELRDPGYGLGLMTHASRHGPCFGHNGAGPGYTASAFHTPGFPRGPLTVCAMCAFDEPELAWDLVREARDLLEYHSGHNDP